MYGVFDSNINACKLNSAIIKRNIILAASESILTGVSFYFGFLLANIAGLSRTYIPSAELTLMSLGAAFTYAFIFVFRKNHRVAPNRFSRFAVTELFKNISCTYLMHLATLFLVKDSGFSSIRNAVLLAYLLSLVGILAVRFILLHFPGLVMAREGKKRLLIKSAESGERIPIGNRIPDLIPKNRDVNAFGDKLGNDAHTGKVRVAK